MRMSGTAVSQVPLPGLVLTGGGGGGALSSGITPSDVNDLRIAMVIDRLTLHVRGQFKSDALEFFNLCLSLARGIDLSIANHEFPSRAQELPSLAKQVCQCKNNTLLPAAIMVLMISVKSACKSGWFQDKDSEELHNLAKEILDGFGSASHLNAEPSCSRPVISTVMSRFYPRMKMGHVFVFLEVKPGFEAYLSDFEIPKKFKTSSGDKIMLFVVQTDCIETSSCLVSPAKVNFLLNGKGVERRTNLFVDNGPQSPTAVTNLLKYGPNLFQAVGEFNGNYIIGIVIMSEMPNPDSNVLQDYEQHAPATVDSDSEIIEGPSRISLNCPISFTRIKTPVKGHSCKHIQSFDFDNYVGINSRRPSWRCPHCNHHVCFTDLRIDKKLVKVLKEAEPNVSDIIISSDGLWNAVMDSDDANQKLESPQTGNLLDLTQTDDRMDFIITTNEIEDRKQLFGNVSQNQPTTQTISIEPHIANTYNDTYQTNTRVEDDFWSGIFLPISGQGLSNVPSNDYIAPPPVLTDSFATNGQVEDFNGNNALFTTPVPQREPSLPNTLQLQQYQFGNSNFTAEYGRSPSLPRNVTRIPTAVQALPAQGSSSILQQSCRSRLAAMQGASVISSSAIHANPHPVSHMSSSSFHQYPGIQENRSFSSIRPHQQITVHPVTNQVPNAQTVLNERQRSIQQMANLRMPRTTMGQPPGPIQSSMHSSANFLQPQQAPMLAPTNIPMQMAIDTSRTTPSYSMNPNVFRTSSMTDQLSNARVASPPLMTTDGCDQNWRPPVGRMRGALSGQAYADAYNRYINQNQPNQQAAQAARPVIQNVNNVPAESFVPLNFPSARPGSMPGLSGIFPNGSSGMH